MQPIIDFIYDSLNDQQVATQKGKKEKGFYFSHPVGFLARPIFSKNVLEFPDFIIRNGVFFC